MTREAFLEFPNAFYHLCSRGLDKQFIFFDHDDFSFFEKTLARANKKFSLSIYAYCLMNNHYHIFLSTPNANISKAMQWINSIYARHFLRKYKHRDGHVFRGRYKKKLVQTELYSIVLIRYIHQNPCKADLAKKPGDWIWSSYRHLLQPDRAHDFLQKQWTLGQFSQTQNAKNHFVEYHEKSTEWTPDQDAKAGIFLGDDDFIKAIIDEYFNEPNDCSEIKGYHELYALDREFVCKRVASLDVAKKEKDKLLIFMLSEFCSIPLRELSLIFNKRINTLSKIKQRVRQDLNMKPGYLELFAEMSDVRMRPPMLKSA